jgi:protein-tyrosine phosphatase
MTQSSIRTGTEAEKVSVLFVCLGNICRSPAAEGIFKKIADDLRLAQKIRIDSAGTGDWHAGELPDLRMRQAASRRGYQLTHRARQVRLQDFKEFDFIFGMDKSNVKNLLNLASSDESARGRISPFGIWLGDAQMDIPDPYGGESEDFENVLDLLERGLKAFGNHLLENHFSQNKK